MIRLTATTILAMLLAACGNKPPSCADAEIFRVAKKMVIDHTSEATYVGFNPDTADPNGLLKKFIDGLQVEIVNVVNDGYKADANKQLCKGTLKITTIGGDVFEQSIQYSAQLTEDQKRNFVLEIQNLQPFINATRQAAMHYFLENRQAK
jgi:hypothetical protein